MSAGLTCSLDRAFVDAEAVDDLKILSIKMPVFFREVAEGRERQRVRIVDQPRKLARVERGLDLTFDFVTEGLRQIVICTELRIESREERQAIFKNRSADIDTGIKLRISVRRKTCER